jgi:hypothetical protein
MHPRRIESALPVAIKTHHVPLINKMIAKTG